MTELNFFDYDAERLPNSVFTLSLRLFEEIKPQLFAALEDERAFHVSIIDRKKQVKVYMHLTDRQAERMQYIMRSISTHF